MTKVTRKDIHRFLGEESIFRGAAPDALERLSQVALSRSVPKGKRLFSMGQSCDALHIVFEGCGLLVKTASEGRERILHRAIPGEMVGAVPFFDGGAYPASFVAESDCVVLSLPRDRLLALFSREPSLCLGVLGGIVGRLRKMVSLLEQMSFEDTEHRLWRYLVDASKNSGGPDYPRTLDPLPTREHIANAIGTVREVVSRRLSRLAESGHLKIEGRRVTLLKPLE